MTSNDTPSNHVADQTQQRRVIGDRGDHFLKRIEGEISPNVSACYQCERCTNACPVSRYMDIKPHQVVRYVQLGWRQELLSSSTIWVCLTCEMCSTYCPNEVAVASLINHLRNLAYQSTTPPGERLLAVFHQTFLEQLQHYGRVNEFWLMNAFNRKPGIMKEKLKSGVLKDEIGLGIDLWRKGRLHLLPSRSKAIEAIKAVYRRNRREVF